ncbi:MAG: toll/interleukin-1 receptor domain-containing protein, partial [Solimonas sp.]
VYLDYLGGMQQAEGEPGTDRTAGSGVQYHVAMSFAGEDRIHPHKLAELLRARNFTVFYDEYEQATLWGRDLYSHLTDVYRNKARYCLMFISANYAKKLWTKHELEAAQARAFRESREYILPIRLDDTTVPGIEDKIGYVDLRKTSYEDIVRLLEEKFRKSPGDK